MTPLDAKAFEIAKEIYDNECPDLTLEWAVDHYHGLQLAGVMPMVLECCDKLIAGQYTEADQFEYNDLDCHAFVVPWASSRYHATTVAFVHTDQNLNFLYVVYRNSLLSASLHGLGITDEATDAIAIYRYRSYERPRLPKLKKLIRDNGTRYNDGRDKAFVTGNAIPGNRVSYSLHMVGEIKAALFNIETLHYALMEETS